MNWFSDSIIPTEEITRILSVIGFDQKLIDTLINDSHPSFNNLSAGQMQRLDTVQTMLASARLKLLDEPFSNLDQENAVKTLNFIKRFTKRSGSISVLTSHNAEIIEEFGKENHFEIKDRGLSK